MDHKYRILEDGNGKFLIQRGRFFIWVYLTTWLRFESFTGKYAQRFDERGIALDWLNHYNEKQQKRQKHEQNSKTIVKCTTLIPEENK